MTNVMDRPSATMSDAEVTTVPVGDRWGQGSESDNAVIGSAVRPFSYPAATRSVFAQHSPGDRAYSLGRLSDNWDGHHAHAPHETAIRRAAALLNALPSGMPLPDVRPGTEGEVLLEWECVDVELMLAIGPNEVEALVELDGVTVERRAADAWPEISSALARIAHGS